MIAPLKNSGRRASVMMIVLGALMILTSAVLLWAAYIRQTITVSGESYNDTEARAMAHSGLAIGMHPLANKETPALTMEEGNDPGFRVRLLSEGAKLNLTFLFTGEDQRKLDIF